MSMFRVFKKKSLKIPKSVAIFTIFISKCYISWRLGPFRICTMVIFDDMLVTIISLIIGTRSFVGNCEILKFVTMNNTFKHHFPVSNKLTLFSTCIIFDTHCTYELYMCEFNFIIKTTKIINFCSGCQIRKYLLQRSKNLMGYINFDSSI